MIEQKFDSIFISTSWRSCSLSPLYPAPISHRFRQRKCDMFLFFPERPPREKGPTSAGDPCGQRDLHFPSNKGRWQTHQRALKGPSTASFQRRLLAGEAGYKQATNLTNFRFPSFRYLCYVNISNFTGASLLYFVLYYLEIR